MNRKYGRIKDRPDDRDFMFKVSKPVALPKSVDLRDEMSPVRDQGDLGCCTGFGSTAALEALHIKNDEITNKHTPIILSPLFVYYYERMIEGTINEDTGAQIRDAVKAMAKYGVSTESMWPYKTEKFATEPNFRAKRSGLNHQIQAYYRINDGDLNNMKQALAKGYPVIFGFTVYSSFESAVVANTGQVPLPKRGEQVLGGHCVLLCGYDDTTNKVLCKNSWGENWGQKGYFFMPYKYVSSPYLASDFWVVTRGENL